MIIASRSGVVFSTFLYLHFNEYLNVSTIWLSLSLSALLSPLLLPLSLSLSLPSQHHPHSALSSMTLYLAFILVFLPWNLNCVLNLGFWKDSPHSTLEPLKSSLLLVLLLSKMVILLSLQSNVRHFIYTRKLDFISYIDISYIL